MKILCIWYLLHSVYFKVNQEINPTHFTLKKNHIICISQVRKQAQGQSYLPIGPTQSGKESGVRTCYILGSSSVFQTKGRCGLYYSKVNKKKSTELLKQGEVVVIEHPESYGEKEYIKSLDFTVLKVQLHYHLSFESHSCILLLQYHESETLLRLWLSAQNQSHAFIGEIQAKK